MRVISGSAKGLKLISPEGLDTRPTLDRVKEALFSMLIPYIGGAAVLDAFAGSGALGIEALSRGAQRAVFLDISKKARDAVITNLEKAGLSDRAQVLLKDTWVYLGSARESFSLIFIDPPYGGGIYEKTLSLIRGRRLLSDGGVIAVEWDENVHVPDFPPEFVRVRDRRYGRVHITLLSLKEKE